MLSRYEFAPFTISIFYPPKILSGFSAAQCFFRPWACVATKSAYETEIGFFTYLQTTNSLPGFDEGCPLLVLQGAGDREGVVSNDLSRPY